MLKVFVFMFESVTIIQNKLNQILNLNQIEETNDMNDDKFESLLKESLLNNNQQMNENMDTFYESMKDSDNSIIDLAKNIAEDLKNESGDNPSNLANMFSNGNGLNGLISSITSKLDNEIKSGKLDQNKLLNDAQKMMGNNANLFGDLFKSMNPQNVNSSTNKKESSNDTLKEKQFIKKKKKTNTKKK